tara:strand:- start:52 stop:753 length:702 start_codon:yes stop_codon:yes gene_type:complete
MSTDQKTSYLDVKNVIRRRIHDTVWEPGSLMPGEVELSQEFGCARATVNRALRELAQDGMIERKRKAGTRIKSAPTRHAKFVIPRIREEIERMGFDYRYALIERKEKTIPDWLCARIGGKGGEDVLHLRCMHYAGSRAFQYEDRWINLVSAPKARAQTFQDINPNEWLIREVPFSDGEVILSTVNADQIMSEMLNVSLGAALFTLERITWLKDMPMTFAKLYFHAGYQMTTRL